MALPKILSQDENTVTIGDENNSLPITNQAYKNAYGVDPPPFGNAVMANTPVQPQPVQPQPVQPQPVQPQPVQPQPVQTQPVQPQPDPQSTGQSLSDSFAAAKKAAAVQPVVPNDDDQRPGMLIDQQAKGQRIS